MWGFSSQRLRVAEFRERPHRFGDVLGSAKVPPILQRLISLRIGNLPELADANELRRHVFVRHASQIVVWRGVARATVRVERFDLAGLLLDGDAGGAIAVPVLDRPE